MTITFTIPGIPRPGGSKVARPIFRKGGVMVTTATGRPVIKVVEAGKHTHEWRANCAFFARQAYQDEPLRGPLKVSFAFVMPRPKSHFRTGKRSNEPKPDAPLYHTNKPDVLKLVRSTEDALTGIMWADDCQTCNIKATKRYGPVPGCTVTVDEMDTGHLGDVFEWTWSPSRCSRGEVQENGSRKKH